MRSNFWFDWISHFRHIAGIPMFGRAIEIDIWQNHTYTHLFQTSLKNAMRKFSTSSCATISEEVVASGQMMFFFRYDFGNYIKFKILGEDLPCTPNTCGDNSITVLLDPKTHPDRCQGNRNPFCGDPVRCEFNKRIERSSQIKCIYQCNCELPTGENVCPGNQRIAVSVEPASQSIKPIKLCGIYTF